MNKWSLFGTICCRLVTGGHIYDLMVNSNSESQIVNLYDCVANFAFLITNICYPSGSPTEELNRD